MYAALCRFELAEDSTAEERKLVYAFQQICIWILTILHHGTRFLRLWVCSRCLFHIPTIQAISFVGMIFVPGHFSAFLRISWLFVRYRFEGSGIEAANFWDWAGGDPHWALVLTKGVLAFAPQAEELMAGSYKLFLLATKKHPIFVWNKEILQSSKLF